MSGERPIIEPHALAIEVERYVDKELSDFERFSNRTPFDESGVAGLHTLMASGYEKGYADGMAIAYEHMRRQQARRRAVEQTAAEEVTQ